MPGLTPIKNALNKAQHDEGRAYDRTYPEWGNIYRTVRLRCRDCDGYMIYYVDKKRNSRYAFCTNECGYTMHADIYKIHKNAVCLALIKQQRTDDLWPFIRTEHGKRERGKSRTKA